MEKVTELSVQDSNGSQLPEINPARYTAVKLLSRHERSDSYIDKLLEHEARHAEMNQLDTALLNEIVTGVIRWKAKLDWILTGFYKGDYQKCLNIIKNAMRVGLYQIVFLNRIPVHAAIFDSVEIVKRIQGDKTAGIVNGVLRNIVRNMENIRYPEKDEDLVYHFATIYSHPKWMVKRWLERFGEKPTENLLIANNTRPNLSLRINTLKTSPYDFYTYLNNNGIQYNQSPYLRESFDIRTPRKSIMTFDAFKNGLITVQDPSASMAVYLAQPSPGLNILDMCAAPGGKSFLLAELMKDSGTVVAMDKYPSKLHFISEGAERLGLHSITTFSSDAEDITMDTQFDIVFADVPCSGLGTLAKKPDIKWKREPEDIAKLVAMQRAILESAVKLVKPGGVLLYSTCSIEPEENIENVNWLLSKYPEFEVDNAEKYIPKALCKDRYMQTFPHIHKIDGAFAARLVKKQDGVNI